ncbi:LON peptidase substrate-binding domain-containing protein [Methylocystis bryophila]|uniref:Peptidase S16 n=1 Tax=Methylocystis bryophila TaxID=655015 RepID=A0A1W6MXZ4_9HYPH|nr:LON peptidase substrate-binding domain-containing protein [Methylocystis bryophila]ARN82386.1 peptidase S16 [Methylocystis bryophila]BDV38557.1 ATP-dependent protease [Methylocystis bryophila]
MTMNRPYLSTDELPQTLRLMPLAGALLLPRGELPLNIFEPRYLAMVDAALASDRLVGMVQPAMRPCADSLTPLCEIGCAGRLTRLAETGDGRYLVTLCGVGRYRILAELENDEPYRSARVDFTPFARDLEAGAGEAAVDRLRMIEMLRSFASSSRLEVDWTSIDAAPTETLVNALAMMSPFGAREKQSLLEAEDLKTRAEILIALAQFDLAQAQSAMPPDVKARPH